MTFNSFSFCCFFVVTLLATWIVGRATKAVSIRNILLLAAGYYFYGSFSWSFLLLLLYVTVLTYGFGIALDRHEGETRKLLIAADIVLTLLPLLFYKYSGFVLSNINLALGSNHGEGLGRIVVPVGLSFFSLQALSYTIDIYRRKIHATTSPIDVALFVGFFPTILSGPIERGRNLLPQIAEHRKITVGQVMNGMTLFVWGVFKKAVVADRLGQYVDWVYGTAEYRNGATLAIAASLYSFQIYCDFSGYSDMAIGVARALGFDIMQNFRFPYFARTMKEFWHKWHVSLTSWFTEYVYFPLGGSRVKTRLRWAFNISMVFLLSGIWHGAAWNFLLWGIIHAALYLAEYKTGLQRPELENRWKAARRILVFMMATLAWIFFRVEDMDRAWMIVGRIVTNPIATIAWGISAFGTVTTLGLLGVFVGCDWLLYRKKLSLGDASQAFTLKSLMLLVGLLLGISLFSVSSESFVYFQF
ncbi:MAG: MBOAT family O-acyltransferase [Bacteroidales bacterium]|nr:MBOAT family O-acyltransferase [Bacteroidales bacterium]